MPILLKVYFTLKDGERQKFIDNQTEMSKALEEDHPGVLMYHVDYPPDDEKKGEFTELYVDDATFCARFDNDRVLKPFGVCGGCCDEIVVKAWGTPNDDSKKILDFRNSFLAV